MKKLFSKDVKKEGIEEEYLKAVKRLSEASPGKSDYQARLSEVERLHALLMNEKENKKSIDPDTVLKVVGQIGALLLVANHERFYNWSKNALNFIPKIR